jgi:hypothetical protein
MKTEDIQGQVLRVRGRNYQVSRVELQTKNGTVEAYQLTGARGAVYTTMRNVPRPEMMFLVGGGKFGMISSVMQGVWLTDADGTLKVAQS